MKKKEIIKKSNDYTNVINKGKKLKNKYYSLFYIKNSNNTLYGISIPKKTGNAVTRNKIKRQIKNIIDNNKLTIQTNYSYVIIVRREILELDYLTKEQELITLFKRIGEPNEK